MVNIPYKVVIENNPKRGPKGKMPVLRDGDRIIPDSSFIIAYLKDKYGNSLDHMLSAQDCAKAHAIQRLIEENLYHVLLFSRWIDPKLISFVDKEFRPFFPKPVAALALFIIRRNLKKQAFAHGMGRHSAEEVYQIGVLDLQAIAELFSKKTYFLGEQPHAIDATVFAFLETIRLSPQDNALYKALQEHNKLLEYCRHMRGRYF